MIQLKTEIELQKRSDAYLQKIYNAKQRSHYDNMVTTDEIYIAPPFKPIIDTTIYGATTSQQLLINLETLLLPNDATAIIELLSEDQKIKLNQNFKKFNVNVKNVTFNSIDQLVEYIYKFIDRINNKVTLGDTKKSSKKSSSNKDLESVLESGTVSLPFAEMEEDPLPGIKAEQLPEMAEVDPLPEMNQEAQLSFPQRLRKFQIMTLDPNWEQTPGKVKMARLIETFYNYVESQISFDDAHSFYIYVRNIVLYQDDFKEYLKIEINTNVITKKAAGRPNADVIPKKLTPRQYKQIVDIMLAYVMPNGVVGGGFMNQKMIKRKLIYGRGISGDFEKGHLFVELSKLNNNVLCVKYIKTKNKKLEVAVSDATKLVILEMLTNKFNIDHYNKLTNKEKKVISVFNTLFKCVDISEMIGDPIEDLYTQFNILKGEIEAGNDNPLIKSSLKETLFELHKYKKINSSQLRNIVYEISNR